MRRNLSLRQIEAFKAVMEHGTMSRAASVINVLQPALSKMIANLEADADLVLFDRVKGRLVPTEWGLRLYEEIDRIFVGVRQVENAIDAIRREKQGRIVIGVMPALAGDFTQQVVAEFRKLYPNVFCVVHSRSSQRITEWLLTRKLDVGLIGSDIDNPYLVSEALLEQSLACIMPPGHPLAEKEVITPADLDGQDFISFDPESSGSPRIVEVFSQHGASPNVVMVANLSLTLCELVAGGHGVALIRPLMARGYGDRLIIRPFEPEIAFHFQVSRNRESVNRNAHLIADFMAAAHETSRRILAES